MYNRRKKFRSSSRKPHSKNRRRSGKRIKKYGLSRGGIRL